jgi:uncharacterized protein YuzE
VKVHFDAETDALYIVLSNADVLESEEVQPGIIIDFDDQNRVVAIEVLRVSDRVPDADLKQFQFEVA